MRRGVKVVDCKTSVECKRSNNAGIFSPPPPYQFPCTTLSSTLFFSLFSNDGMGVVLAERKLTDRQSNKQQRTDFLLTLPKGKKGGTLPDTSSSSAELGILVESKEKVKEGNLGQNSPWS